MPLSFALYMLTWSKAETRRAKLRVCPLSIVAAFLSVKGDGAAACHRARALRNVAGADARAAKCTTVRQSCAQLFLNFSQSSLVTSLRIAPFRHKKLAEDSLRQRLREAEEAAEAAQRQEARANQELQELRHRSDVGPRPQPLARTGNQPAD